jgi:hypothetical protein
MRRFDFVVMAAMATKLSNARRYLVEKLFEQS